MNTTDRRGLNLGIALMALGVFFLVRRELHLTGPGPILLLIGTVLFAISALRGFRGPVVPAGVLLGLGTGFLLRDPLEPWMPPWATLLALSRRAACSWPRPSTATRGRERRPSTLVPGLVLVAIAALTALEPEHRPARTPLRGRVEALAVGARGGGTAPRRPGDAGARENVAAEHPLP